MLRALLLSLLLAGCVPPAQWIKPGVTPEQAERDQKECNYEARKATAAIANPFNQASERIDLEWACLGLRGYRRK